MILWIDEDRVVRASRHAGFATDADRFVKIDYAVCALEHRRRRTGSYAGRVRALITAGDLVRPPRLRKDPDVDVLNVSAGDPDGNDILRLTCGGACVTADATRVVDYLGPLYARIATWLLIRHLAEAKSVVRTITRWLAPSATSMDTREGLSNRSPKLGHAPAN
jgi:hypothetical protein